MFCVFLWQDDVLCFSEHGTYSNKWKVKHWERCNRTRPSQVANKMFLIAAVSFIFLFFDLESASLSPALIQFSLKPLDLSVYFLPFFTPLCVNLRLSQKVVNFLALESRRLLLFPLVNSLLYTVISVGLVGSICLKQHWNIRLVRWKSRNRLQSCSLVVNLS